MTSTVAPVAALLLSVAILLMGNGLQGTLLPVRANMESFGALNIGVLGSSYFLGFAAGCLSGAKLVRRAGHIRVFTAMVAIASSVALAHALFVEPIVWWFLRATTGFCFAVLYMIIESWLNESATNETRGMIFSVYTIVNLTVITLGQLMLTFASPQTFALFSLASILVSLAAVPVAMTRSPGPSPIESTTIRFRYLYRLSPVGFVGCFAVGMSNGAFWSLAPVFAQGDEQDTAAVALFMSIAVIAGAMGQWPLGKASDQTDRRKVMIAACLGGAAAGLGMVLFLDTWDRSVLVFAYLFGFFAFPVYSLSVAHMNDFVEEKGFVEAASGLLLLFAAGAVTGPIVASAMMRLYGVHSLFAWTAMVHISLAIFVIIRMRMRAPVPRDERAHFTESLRVAQTVSNVDPSTSESDQGQTTGDGGSRRDREVESEARDTTGVTRQ